MLLELFKRFKHSHPKPSGQSHHQVDNTSTIDHPRPKSNQYDFNQSINGGPRESPQKYMASGHDHSGHAPVMDPPPKSNEWHSNRISPTPETNFHQGATDSSTGSPQPSSQGVNFFRNARRFKVNHSNIVGISGSNNVVNYFNSGKAALDHLLPYVCAGAAVDSSERDPPPSCHPGTREEIRSGLATWFDDPERQRNMIWLTGPAGTGKSAVAQTFAELCVEKGRLGAAFFFSRPNERDKPGTVIPTLAYQLAIHFPDYRLLLTDRIAYDPTILQKTPRAQFMRLIVEPFSTLQVQGHPVTRDPLLVLLDGLDECQGIPAQCEFVEMIAEVVRLKKGLPLLWLICSRPEPHLKHIFSRPDYSIECLREELLIDAKTRDDVDLYLRDGFAKLRADFRDVVNSSWPSSSQFNRVSKITSGLFVLASTIMKYLSDPGYANPMARLVDVLEFMRNAHRVGMRNPLEALDLFYSNILIDIPDDVFLMTKRILSHHIALRSSHYGTFPVQTLCNLLNIDRSAFYVALRKLHSVVDVPPPEDTREGYLRFYHASFEDYLSNPIRSGKFAIDLNEARAEMADLCPFTYKIERADPDPEDDSTRTFEDIMQLLQTRILGSEDCYQTLLQANGANAQRILDILQMLLSAHHLVDDAARRPILITFLRLSATSGLFPRQLKFHNIVQPFRPVGGGGYADIYKVQHQGRPLCLKVMRLHQRSDSNPLRNITAHEVRIWGQLAHPNILPFYGICHPDDGHRIGLVSPWVANGSLPEYLNAHPHTPRLPIVHGVLAGLRYLHRQQIVHGDIKGANILIKDDRSACLVDFGTSSVIDLEVLGQILPPNNSFGTVRWCAPELLGDSEDGPLHRSFSNDIYSLASTMFEIFTGKVPFFEFHNDPPILMRKVQGRTPARPSHEMAPELTDTSWTVMEHCWSLDPHDRPPIDEVINELFRNAPLLPQDQPAQNDFWRPPIIWTEAEMNVDRAFLLDFFDLR